MGGRLPDFKIGREEGFYWVRHRDQVTLDRWEPSEWEPAQWCVDDPETLEGYWSFIGDDSSWLQDDYLAEVGGRILAPE